eukprot:TRINITY_DN5128_c0_g1_i1.p1 TRINITY_DN5128_c0_g1~~TRINITY_DN5128_c0_g1_i1.p1  ORF type:complete len:134 (-),score=25.78 TRINITY_DN5128_c0_g1_i1:568-969(-)
MEQDIIRMIEARQMRTLSTHLNYVRESFRKEREIMDNRLDELMSIAFGREDEFYQSNLFSFIRRHRAEERYMENLFEDFIRKSQWRQHQVHQERRMRDLEALMRRFAELDEEDDDIEDDDDYEGYHYSTLGYN